MSCLPLNIVLVIVEGLKLNEERNDQKEGELGELDLEARTPSFTTPPTISIPPPIQLANMHPSALPLVITPFLRRFPTEIYNEILKFCDPSSLAKVARVPLAFLELSSPLLYRDVKLFGLEKMAKLFCGREVRHESSPASSGRNSWRSSSSFPPSLPTLPPSPPNLSSSLTSPSFKSEPSPPSCLNHPHRSSHRPTIFAPSPWIDPLPLFP